MESETQTLTEADAQRLEGMGFKTEFEHDPNTGRAIEVLYTEYDNYIWNIGSKINAALIGVLTEMCRKKMIEVFQSNAPLGVVIREGGLRVTWGRNATPREIFDALLDALEVSDGD